MKNFKRTAVALSALIALLCVTGCDYIPRTVYEIELKNGETLKLACPTVDAGRSEISYIIDGDCVAYK